MLKEHKPDHDNPDGYHMTATIDDGSGSIDNDAQSSAAVANDYWLVDVTAIEMASPGRQIKVQIQCTGNPAGRTFVLGPLTGTNAVDGTGVYSRTSPTTAIYSTNADGGSGSVTFTECSVGSNTAKGTFSFIAVSSAGTIVNVTAGTFGK